MKKLFATSLIAVLLCACAAQPQINANIEAFGTFAAIEPSRVQFAGSLTGMASPSRSASVISNTDSFAAVQGTRFGVAYRLSGKTNGTPIRHRVTVIYPEGGMTNPTSGKHQDLVSWDQVGTIGEQCHAGFIFTQPWEIVPGKWTVEIWVDGSRVITKTFLVRT